MTMYVVGWCLFAVTLTTHAIFTPDQWRAICKRFRQSLIRVGYAGVWRVELQRRKAPHLHVAFWLPDAAAVETIRALWLRATGEDTDPCAIAHAVHARAINQDDAGWAVYMGLHDGKHKAEQLGWLGKQWGIWNREKYTARAAEVFELTARQHAAFVRFLRRLEIANRRAAAVNAWNTIMEGQWHTPQAVKAWALIRSFRARGMVSIRNAKLCTHLAASVRVHNGNLLRLMRGETAARILRGMQSGALCHISKLSPV